MKSRWRLILPLILAVLTCGSVLAQSPASTPAKPEGVTTLDGRTFFGLITIKDDYTISIATDSGLTNLPIASLQGDSWKKYSKDPDRKGDGRFWTERQDGLTKKGTSSGQTQPMASVLNEINVHLGEIAIFKETKAKTDADKPAASPTPPSVSSAPVVELKLFSGPGGFSGGGVPAMPGMPTVPTSLPSLPSAP